MSLVMHDADRRRILPPACFLSALVVAIVGHVVWPLTRILPWPWTLVGVLPLAAGVGFNLLADRDFKRHQTTVKPYEDSRRLLTGGVFALSRNPMYLGMTLILLGTGALLGSLWPLLVAAVFAVTVQVVYIQHEEARLARVFGDAWLTYRRTVRPWL